MSVRHAILMLFAVIFLLDLVRTCWRVRNSKEPEVSNAMLV